LTTLFSSSCEGGILLKLTYGAVTDAGLDFAKMSLDIVKAFTAATSGHLVDVFPFCEKRLIPDYLASNSSVSMFLCSKIPPGLDAWSRIQTPSRPVERDHCKEHECTI